ncbi:amine oxidase [Stereum hirsutum FP-91666 SS1]|uniref:amine oxidase n=1 Tax=Stereum hirsutum (strain FP-91666) TaxID=721885 RepID=UPI000440F13D|nr:amine oxidase [Stereum hirsutum FP-91666 SS1]EIM90264.1 amine oxidase [Stereum hirsutum FP-91666 SS1]
MYIPFISEPVVAADFSSISLSIPPVLGTAFSPATWLWLSTVFHSVRFAFLSSSTTASVPPASSPNDNRVLILGGGVAGLHAAQTLHQQGVDDFIIIEARTELGGRMKNFTFGASGREYVLEAGANWIHGTQTGDGPTNPIYKLAQKHNLTMQLSDYFGSMTTYDHTGEIDYLDVFHEAVDSYVKLTAGAGGRVPDGLVDTTSRIGYSLIGAKPKTHHEMAAEYYSFDWEYAESPEETSWIASSWANNFTFNPEQGGFSGDNLMSTDQRGFGSVLLAEAAEFLTEEQLMLDSTVEVIQYSEDGVSITLNDGSVLTADYALVTFSLGVLQNDDLVFQPELPAWKTEAIHGMTMGTYTKIFLQFPEKFWFDTEFALYADEFERGRYPVWQSLDNENFFPGSGILFVTVTGHFAKRIERYSDEQVKEEVLEVLRSMYPNETIPEPDAFYLPRWNSDPLYRGSFSNWPASLVTGHHLNLRATVEDRLWFAGEATSQRFFGYLHGAYYEGGKMAGHIAHCMRGDVCIELPHLEEVKNATPYDMDTD